MEVNELDNKLNVVAKNAGEHLEKIYNVLKEFEVVINNQGSAIVALRADNALIRRKRRVLLKRLIKERKRISKKPAIEAVKVASVALTIGLFIGLMF